MNLAAWRIREWRPGAQEQHRRKERCISKITNSRKSNTSTKIKRFKDPKERVKEASEI
jgi:hypothetical protein